MNAPDHPPGTSTATCRGIGLVELLISVTLFTVVLLASMAMVDSGRRFSRSTMQITHIEDLAQQMLFKMEKELANAAGFEPVTPQPASSQLDILETTELESSSTAGFPPRGMLLLAPGEEHEERITYASLNADGRHFDTLTRGEQCTSPATHTGFVYWAGMAEPIAVQDTPPTTPTGSVLGEDGNGVLFSGDGFGFTYRVPIDPSGGNDFLVGDELQLGADVPGVGPTLNGWKALIFEAKETYDESITGDDINRDGSADDVFDIGQIRVLTWADNGAGQISDFGIGPSNIIQERCNYGGDLDSDGFDDPIFLWNRETNLLEVRLFLLGSSDNDIPIVRRVQSVMFLRNEPEL